MVISRSPERVRDRAPEPVPGRPDAPAAAVRALTLAVTCSAVGDGSFYVTSTIFFTRVLGLSPARVGLALSLAWGAGFVLSAPLGHLADRVGLRPAAVGLSLATALALVGVTIPVVLGSGAGSGAGSGVGGWAFLSVVCCYGVAQSALGGVRQALLVRTVPPALLVSARARLHVAINAGIGAGAALGGLALLDGGSRAFVAVLWFDALAFTAAAALTARVPGARHAHPAGHAAPSGRLDVLRDRRYLTATLLSGVLHLYMPMLGVALPLYAARFTAAPAWSVALVFAVNTAGVLLLQVRAARTVRDTAGAARALRVAGGLLLLSCVVLAAATGPASPAAALLVLVAGVAVQVCGEVLLASGAWHVGFALADPDRPGQWQSLFASAPPLARAAGPGLLTALLVAGPRTAGEAAGGWLALGLAFAAAGALLARTAQRPPA